MVAPSSRVIRGGSWNNRSQNLRPAIRNNRRPDNRNNDLGFRLVRTLILPEKVVYGLLSRAQGFVQTIILRCPIKGQTKKFGLFLLVANERKMEQVFFIGKIS